MIVDIRFSHDAECRHGYGKPPHPQLFEIIDRNKDKYDELLRGFAQLCDRLLKIDVEQPDHEDQPYWANRWIPPLDAISIYGMITLNRPEYYIEIGSGNSTKFARRAISDNDLATQIISIDPNPRASIDQICSTVIRKPLQNVDLSVFDLPHNSIVFVDGSHRVIQNSDVTVFFTEILPDLKKGTVVGLHDILLPYDYPPTWLERFYSEQYLLACCLLFGGNKFEIVLPNAYVTHTLKSPFALDNFFGSDAMKAYEPHGAAFWMRLK